LVYQVEDDELVLLVLAVDKREDSAVYKSAVARLVEAAAVLANPVKSAVKNSHKT
jgi:mRNA interferase RelE/StbE